MVHQRVADDRAFSGARHEDVTLVAGDVVGEGLCSRLVRMNSVMSPGAECGGQASGKVAAATAATSGASEGSETSSTTTCRVSPSASDLSAFPTDPTSTERFDGIGVTSFRTCSCPRTGTRDRRCSRGCHTRAQSYEHPCISV